MKLPKMHTSRRSFLASSLAGLGVGLTLGRSMWPGVARAGVGASKRKFIFVFAQGGWDPTRVFAPEFSNPNVDLEAAAERAVAGGIAYVSHPDRPSVDVFMQAWHDRSVVFNGVMVRSIAHEICTMLAMTGTTSGLTPDWPAILADQDRGSFTLPHLVLGGPSFPGNLGVAVARTGAAGQLEALLNGSALGLSDIDVATLRSPSQALVDRFVSQRAAARASVSRSKVEDVLAADFNTATQHAADLKDLQYLMDFTGGTSLADQAVVAVEALQKGISRCLTLSSGAAFGWDTHAQNDDGQSPLWEGLFSGLGQLVQLLANAPGEEEASLLDETVVCVLSEMGRTPLLNGVGGKDHWPYTSVMLLGAGLTGDRVVGGFDTTYYGQNVDPASGDVAEGGEVLSAEAIGATLLALADVDPADYVMGVQPIDGVIA
jgi:uncharacterized protein (DUF1501 family)